MNTMMIEVTEQQADIIRAVLFTAGSFASLADEDTFDGLADLFDVEGDNDYNLK